MHVKAKITLYCVRVCIVDLCGVLCRFEVDLRAGEALYLPAGWLHDIKSSGIYQSITYWMYANVQHYDDLVRS